MSETEIMPEDLYGSLELSQEQYSDLQNYIPKSDMVRMVLNDTIHRLKDNPAETDEDWHEVFASLIHEALGNGVEPLMDLLEIVYLHGYNEGELNYAAEQKGA